MASAQGCISVTRQLGLTKLGWAREPTRPRNGPEREQNASRTRAEREQNASSLWFHAMTRRSRAATEHNMVGISLGGRLGGGGGGLGASARCFFTEHVLARTLSRVRGVLQPQRVVSDCRI